jgi:hypothetical protein
MALLDEQFLRGRAEEFGTVEQVLDQLPRGRPGDQGARA